MTDTERLRYDKITGRLMPEVYRSVLKLLSIRTGGKRVVYPVAAQTITPASGLLYRYGMQPDFEQSPRSL